MPHWTRTSFATLSPLHVTLRIVRGLPTLRTPRVREALRPVFVAAKERGDFRVVQLAVMHDHVHLIVEADDSTALARGMQGLLVRLARALNKALFRRGKVFADRYHARLVRTTIEGKNAIGYVLGNARKHGIAFEGMFDPYSSAAWFDGWDANVDPERALPDRASPVAAARSWQLRDACFVHGHLSPFRVPGGWAREA